MIQASAGPAVHPAPRRTAAVRALFTLAAIGAFCSPPLANIAGGLGLLALLTLPGLAGRLRAAAAQPLVRGALVLLLVLAIATLWADDVPWPRRFAEWWSWRALLLMAGAFIVFDSAAAQERFAGAMVAALALGAVASFVLLALPGLVTLEEPGVILRNHTTQAMAMVVGIILAGALLWRGAGTAVRTALVLAVVLFLANLMFVATGRSGHFALLVAAAAAAFTLLQGRRRWIALALVPLLGVVLLASSAMVRERFATAVGEFDTGKASQAETSMGLRVVIWETTAHLLQRHPILGYGVGGFAPAYAQEIHQHYSGWQAAEAKDTHNQYLRVWVDAGIPGLLALAVFLAGVLRQPAGGPLAGAARALFIAWMATSLFNSHFQTFAESHLIALVAGALLAPRACQEASAASAAASTVS